MSAPAARARRPNPHYAGLSPARLKIVIIALAVLAVAIAAAVGALTYKRRMHSFLAATESGVKILAQSFNPEELAALKGSPSDAETDACEQIKKRLRRVHAGDANAADTNITAVQLLRHDTGTGRTLCLIDVPEPGDPDAALQPGAPLRPDAATAAAISELVRGRDVAVRLVPGGQSMGFMGGYGVVNRRENPGGGATLDIVHYKIDAHERITNALASIAYRVAGILLLFFLPVGVYFVTRGNTRQEHTLHELMMAIDQSESGITVSTLDKHMAYVNEGMVRQRGYTREELMSMNWWEHFADPQEDIEKQWRALFTPGLKPYAIDVKLRRKNGEIFPARIAVTPIFDKKDGKKVVSCINICTDLSVVDAPKRLLEQEKRRAEDASRAKSAFIAMMSHEVRTPLNGIVGFASLLLDTPLAPAQEARVRSIRRHGEALVRVATNILDMSRIESGGVPPEMRECDPTGLVLEVLGDAAENAPAGARAQFRSDIAPGVPDSLLLDSRCLKHILINLVATATRHAGATDVEISLRPAGPPPRAAADDDRDDDAFLMEASVRGANIVNAAPSCRDESPADAPPLSLMIARRLAGLMGSEIIRDERDPAQFVFTFLIRCKHRPGLARATDGA